MRFFSGHAVILAGSRRADLSLFWQCRRRCVGDAYGSGIAPAILHLAVGFAENHCRILSIFLLIVLLAFLGHFSTSRQTCTTDAILRYTSNQLGDACLARGR